MRGLILPVPAVAIGGPGKPEGLEDLYDELLILCFRMRGADIKKNFPTPHIISIIFKRVFIAMRKLSHAEIVDRQKSMADLPKLPFCVVLNNIRSLLNVGAIFRCADGAGIEKVWLCGITGYPPQSEIAKTALGAQDHVTWEYHKEAVSVVKQFKNQGYKIVLLEQMEKSIPYERFVPQGPVCLIVGNEIEGIADEILPLCDACIEIEMAGIKNSLNVAVAFGIVAYHVRNVLKHQSNFLHPIRNSKN